MKTNTRNKARKNVRGWDGIGGGKEVEEGTYVYLLLFDSMLV